MAKNILDPGSIIVDVGGGDGPDIARHGSTQGWPVKWYVPDLDSDNSALSPEILDLVARLDEGGVEGLLLPAVQKVSPVPGEATLPLTFSKISDQSLEALERIAQDFEGDNVVFLDPAGTSAAGHLIVKLGDLKGEPGDTQDGGAWSPLSDFGDTDILL